MIFRKSKGSATVESAMVYPVLIIAIFLMLSAGIGICSKVKELSERLISSSSEILNPAFPSENMLRLKFSYDDTTAAQ